MAFTHRLALLLLGLTSTLTVHGKVPSCQFHWEMQRARRECQTQLKQQMPASTGCHGEWDNFSCWQSAAVGHVMTLPCPSPLLNLFGKNGNLSRNCTEKGWSDVYPVITVACWSNSTDEPSKVSSLSVHFLCSLALPDPDPHRCGRGSSYFNNYSKETIRDVSRRHRRKDTSKVGCRASLVLFNYFVMANFFWLLVEGLYLHTLLLVIHSYSPRLSMYMLIGWGIPLVFMLAWIICRINLEDTRCWEMNDNPVPDRLMNWPIMASVIINFILFISIIRILVQKLRCTDVGGNEQSQYKRLAKSTLLLIPLFGVNYVVLVYLMKPTDRNMERIKIVFELGLGSYQGLIVAVLYCFLNSEVQSELRRTWRSLSLKRYVGRDYRLHTMSVSRNGNESSQFPRNSRAQSILQTETTVL
ncbi:vasoactive intestinal polypeptide receptor 2-like [Etheostoma cragini]|uniref:vasoactive intestinal polypeptide receptor 2-like n=1 Tax=Etheostoma cragini TaxID=417921 RepID=UPI00155EF67D|nr:vasoactive intestinal polypeptide receptor 2-like [Etheostoma cragini]